MFKKLVPFNSQKHAGKKILSIDSYQFAENTHIASLLVNEFRRAAPVYPIVFLKDAEDQYGSYALFGLEQGENLFIDAEGRWNVGYIPAIIRRYPFALGKGEGQDQFLICLDEESEFISESEGQPLVNEDGKPGEVVEKAKEFLSELYKSNQLTSRFCKELEEQELLTPLNMQIKGKGEEKAINIAGCYGVDERKLNELSDEKFVQMRKNGILPLIYAHLISLAQIERLVRLKNEGVSR